MKSHSDTTHTARAGQTGDKLPEQGQPGTAGAVRTGMTKADLRRMKGAKPGFFHVDKFSCWMTGNGQGVRVGIFALLLTLASCREELCPTCVLALENIEQAPYIVTVSNVSGVEPFTMQPGAVEFVEIQSNKSVLVTGYYKGNGNDFQQTYQCDGECGFVRVILKQ